MLMHMEHWQGWAVCDKLWHTLKKEPSQPMQLGVSRWVGFETFKIYPLIQPLRAKVAQQVPHYVL